VWAQTPFLIGDAQHVEYLIDMEVNDEVKVRTQDFSLWYQMIQTLSRTHS